MRALSLAAAALMMGLVSCGKKGGGGDDSSPFVNPGGPESYAAKGSTPPVVVTFNVSFADNVPLSMMEALATKFETANKSLWNVTEGQIRIGRLRISDNSHPDSKSDQYSSLNLSAHDIVVWSPTNFTGPGIAYVLVGSGRFGRFMGIPYNIANTTLMHEMGHFLFQLSWPVAPVLIDEYEEDPDDAACLMELTYTPLKWCSAGNHLTQPKQPHSCWTQILIDYPDFSYMGQDTTLAPLPPPIIEFTDTP